MLRWYVVNTQSRSEEKAEFHLKCQGFEVYCPRYLKRRHHARKFDWVSAPMFPGYMFVALDLERDQWRSIRSTPGVLQFICHGELPTPVPQGIVEALLARETRDGVVPLNFNRRFEPGESVKVVLGAMADQIGVFDCADDQQRVFVLLDIMGRQVRVRLPAEAVAATG